MILVVTPKAGNAFDLTVDYISMRLMMEGLRKLESPQSKDLADTLRDALVRWPALPQTV